MVDNKKTILIVEDETPLLKIYAERFAEEGFLVLKASNGQEGLELAIKEKPDLILTDILMPVMDGLTMTQKLRKINSWGKMVPIILLTNLTADVGKIKKIVVENSPVYYLLKSDWSLGAIVDKIKEQLAILN
ncbi:MAG: response regulator [Candidatus Staskawiczbacteria bacterium]|nr:response regulator [Candidatus Staskawiczbacteria bacterium]